MRSLFLTIFTAFTLNTFAKEVKHRFICVDNGRNQLIHVNQFNPARNWKVKVPAGTRDLQLLGNGKVLVSHGNGASIYKLTDGSRTNWTISGHRGIQSARRLIDGNTVLLSISGDIFEYNPDAKLIKQFKIEKKDLDLRLLRVMPDGNYLIGAKKPFAVLEVSSTDGKVIKEFPLPHKGYKAVLTPRNTILASTGDAVKVVEIDLKSGKTFSYVGSKPDHPKLGLDFFSGFDILASGNIVAANWLGHEKQGTAAHLVEFDRKNGVVWQWADHGTARQVTNLLMLDNLESCERLYQGFQNKPVSPLSQTAKRITLEKAYEISNDYSKFITTKAGPVIGYKVAYASLASQRRWNIKSPVYGPLYQKQLIENGGTIELSTFVGFHIETEIGFKISKDIDKPISTVMEANDYIESIHTCFDIPDNFFNGPVNVSDVAAAGGCAANLVVGKGVNPKKINYENLNLKLNLGKETVYQGKATNVMGDPRRAVIWLANTLLSQGKMLKKGQLILAGAVASAYYPKGDLPAKGTYMGTADNLPPIKITIK